MSHQNPQPPNPYAGYPPPPKSGPSSGVTAAIVVAVVIVAFCAIGGVLLVLGAEHDSSSPAERSGIASSAPAEPEAPAPAYDVVDDQQSGLGREVVVAVAENEDTDLVFQAALDDLDAFSVTVVCASAPDPRQDGYLLYGTRDDGIVQSDDRAC